MWESTYSVDFQGLWEEWETVSFIVGLPSFHQAVISTAGAAAFFAL